MPEGDYLIKTACSPNTFHHAPMHEENILGKIPLSVTSVFSLRFKDQNKKRRVTLKSKYLKNLQVLKLKEAEQCQQLELVKSFK